MTNSKIDENRAKAQRIAKNIIALAHAIDAGTLTLDSSEMQKIEATYELEYSANEIARIMDQQFLDMTATSYITMASLQQMPSAADFLGPEVPSLDDLSKLDLKICSFLAKYFWNKMVKTEHQPDSSNYLSFQELIEKLRIHPQSDAVLTLLDVTRDKFRCVDQAHALNEIAQDIEQFQEMQEFFDRNTEEILRKNNSLIDLQTAFAERTVVREAEFMKGIARRISLSALTDTQVINYLGMKFNHSFPLSTGSDRKNDMH